MMLRHLTRLRPMFAEDGAGGGAVASEETQEQTNGGQDTAPKSVEIDYDKIAQIIEGKQRASEESVLKGYLKEQGLTQEEMQNAIADYKKQKAEKTPDISAITKERDEAVAKALRSEIRATAFGLADELGLTSREMPYVIKLADLTAVVEDGKVNTDKLKESINNVLTELPQLKPSKEQQTGFKGKVGSDGGDSVSDKESMLRKAMGL